MHAIFYNGASFASKTIISELRKHLGLSKMTLIDHQPPFSVDGVEIIQMDVEKIMYLDYPGGLTNCDALEPEMILSMAECEIQCMRMFDKAAKVGRRLVWQRRRVKMGKPMFRELNTTETYDRRKHQYLSHLQFWNDYLDSNQVDALFLGTIPYAMWDYILLVLCEKRSIPVVLFQHLLIDGYSLPVTSLEGPHLELQETIADIAREFDGRENEILLSEPSEKFIEKHSNLTKDPHPEYYDMTLNEYTPMTWRTTYIYIKSLIKGFLVIEEEYSKKQWIEIISLDYWLQFLKDRELKLLRQYYDSHADFRIEDIPYIYVALAYQPEVSTCPSGGVLVDQELMVLMLAKAAPKGVTIAVKEHPGQKSLSRSLDFYELLQSIPNVRLVPRNLNTFRLIEGASATATITGSIIMESLFRETPVIAFGEHNSVYAPGVIRTRTKQDVENAFNKVFKESFKPTPAGNRIFLSAIERLWYRCDNWGRRTDDLQKFSRLTHEENGVGLARAFADVYQKIIRSRDKNITSIYRTNNQ